MPKRFSIQNEVAHPHCLLRVLATCQVMLDILCKKSCVPCSDLKVRRISEAISSLHCPMIVKEVSILSTTIDSRYLIKQQRYGTNSSWNNKGLSYTLVVKQPSPTLKKILKQSLVRLKQPSWQNGSFLSLICKNHFRTMKGKKS